MTPEEREEAAKIREPSKLLAGDEIPAHLRVNNPPPVDTAPRGTLSVNENAAKYKEIADEAAEKRAQEAIEEARDPKRMKVMRLLQQERKRMQEKSEVRSAAAAAKSAKEETGPASR